MAVPPSVSLKIEVQSRHLQIESSFPEGRTEGFVLERQQGLML